MNDTKIDPNTKSYIDNIASIFKTSNNVNNEDNPVKLLSSLNSNFMIFNKNIVESNKSIVNELKKLSGNYKATVSLDHSKKKQDDSVLNELRYMKKIESDSLQFQKENLKRNGSGSNWLLNLLGLAGIGAAVGLAIAAGIEKIKNGITDKFQNLMQDFWKSVLKYSPIRTVAKIFDKFLIHPLIDVGAKIAKYIGKPIKSIMKTFSSIGKLIGKEGVESVGKVVGKTAIKDGAKLGFKRIPVLGSLLSLWFGIQRFKKGDVTGGLLELASGATSLLELTGVGAAPGIALGLAIDGFLAIRDLKMVTDDKTKKTDKDALQKFDRKTIGNIPGISNILDVMDGIKLWKDGKKRLAIKSFSKALGMGPIMGIFDYVLGKDEETPLTNNEFKFNDNNLTSTDQLVGKDSLTPLFNEAAKKYNVNPNLISAIAGRESNYNDPKFRLSSAGAIGTMQLMPSTAAYLGVNPYDTKSNIFGGTHYISDLLKQFGGNEDLALAAYNGGPERLNDRSRDISRMPLETRNYVDNVLKRKLELEQPNKNNLPIIAMPSNIINKDEALDISTQTQDSLAKKIAEGFKNIFGPVYSRSNSSAIQVATRK